MNATGSSRSTKVWVAVALVAGWHVLSLVGFALHDSVPSFALAVDRLVNRNGRYSMRGEGPVETLEALAWLVAVVAYAAAYITRRRALPVAVQCWLLVLAVLCFVALGEEASWGQHLFHWRAPEAVRAVNLQNETNVHNLDLGLLLGVDRASVAYRALWLLMKSVNPAFFAVCVLLFVVLPTARERGVALSWPLVRHVPIPEVGTRVFCLGGLVAYVIIDKLVVDCGELMELTIALTAALSAMDAREVAAAAGAAARFPQTSAAA